MVNDLIFFNKEGDSLNFRWLPGSERWEGNLIFNENSSDTFKTIGLYMFEKIPSFEYEQPGILELDKFQLFNEYRFDITGNSYMNQPVISIELVNVDPNFYSKWINGDHFESKYPIGTQIVFNSPVFEFINQNISYTVVETKKNGILVISNVDNSSFNAMYGSQIGLTSSYANVTISGLNSIGVYNYVGPSLNNLLSSWSEPDFYSKYYVGKKLTLINTGKNDGVVTINNIDIYDKVYYKYALDINTFTQSQDVLIELVLKTELPLVYTGGLYMTGSNIQFSSTVPTVLKPGTEFVIPSSILNSNAIVVDSIPTFVGNTNLTYYATQSQVVWNNSIYQCVQAYTWTGTSSINPSSASYWSSPTYLPVTTTLSTESLLSVEIHLTTNKIYYQQPFTQSNVITLSSAAANYINDFNFFNIDLYYESSKIHADLIYSSLYSEVNFYPGVLGTYSYGTTTKIYEKNVGILETLKPEVNENINTNFSYNIVFTDLDEFGLIININGHVYQEEIDWVYVGLTPNLQRTIDKTLRNWFTSNFTRLVALGIFVNLQYIGVSTSIYFNSMNIQTEYPNVPLEFTVEVGTTADYYIEHSEVIFTDMSNYLNININGRDYGQSVTVTGGTPSINTALVNWVDNYYQELVDYGIYTSSINSMLIFRVKKQNQRLVYTIKTGKSSLPGIDQYAIINKISGHFGSTIASNEIILTGGTYSFEDNPFATGQVVSINNDIHPYDNQEYNILYLGSNDLVLSYQGPFWGTTNQSCSMSPYINISFNTGFGATSCPPGVIGGGGFNLFQFSNDFSLNVSSVSYDTASYPLSNTNLVDIIYLQLTSCMYVLGDNLTVMDSNLAEVITTITLGSSSLSIKFNPINNYLYCLSADYIYIIDPLTNTIVSTITLTSMPSSMEINTNNGDIYVTYGLPTIDIWLYNNLTSTPTTTFIVSGNAKNIIFNEGEGDVYVTQDDSVLSRIKGSTRALYDTYSFTNLSPNIFYEPVNSSIYIFDSVSLININNGVQQSISSISSAPFGDVLYNNITGDVVISQDSQFASIDLSGSLLTYDSLASYGYLSISQYSGEIYLASQNYNQVLILNGVDGSIQHAEFYPSITTKIIYNQDRKSMFGIQPITNTVIEISTNITLTSATSSATYSTSYDGNYGTLDPDYIEHVDLWLKTREYIRKPRENYNDDPYVKYVWKWKTDEYPQMFIYDFSGSQLSTTGPLAYTGAKPLELVSLNRFPNKNISVITLPEFQQTIFDEIIETLDHVDSSTDLSIIPEPMETFLGFRSDDEGPITSTLLLYKREDISFTITTNSINLDIMQFKFIKDKVNGDYGMILLNINSTSVFTFDSNDVTRGLKPGQNIQVFITDNTNSKNKYISFNNGKTFTIRNIYTRYIVVDFIDVPFDEFTQIDDYPSMGKTTYLTTKFIVVDKEIGRFTVSGQTEIEDIRYKIELSNVGQNIGPDDVFIFKPYDINEQGVDWGYLNRKRKEMMMVRHDIFPYVGSYKSIINAINYFGYNDLELYEYYRNINVNSPDFFKLFKVEIPDIFDNSVAGFTVNDFLKHTMPNPNFEDTNLFNLTYKITDKEGNNVLMYSLAEVILKLEGLKFWLQKNVIPITHRVLDITGRADFVGVDTISHRNNDVTILNVNQSMTPIDFKLNEAYLMPVNSGSTVYTCHIDFYNATASVLPDYFTIKIRTYKTYKEWTPFTTYTTGDMIVYYGKVYESVIINNKIKNPRKYENTPKWNLTTDYILGQFVNYDRYIYEYVGTQSSFISFGTASTITPYYDTITNNAYAKWIDVTEWKNLDFIPVQYITENRTGTHSFNFTIDSNIDPFVVIEVTSDNGYGQIYTSKKNYEIRGANDLSDPIRYIDPIGPFVPITEIVSPSI